MCAVLLPLGVNPIAVNKYIISSEQKYIYDFELLYINVVLLHI